MPYLQVDGITIPVAARSDKIAVEEVGTRGRAFSGAAYVSLRAYKREITAATTPFIEETAEALLCLLQARGLFYSFDDTTDSTSGFYPVTGSNISYPDGETSADAIGAGQRAVNDVPFGAHLGVRSIYLDAAATNLLSDETSTFVTTTGSAAAVDSATLARAAAVSVDSASGSLQVTTSGVANSVRGGCTLPTAAVVAGGTYTGSCYLRAAAGSPTLRVSLTASGGGASAAVNATLSTTEWTRVHTPSLAVGAGQTVSLSILEETADSAVSWYVDCAQIEAGYGPTAWLIGGSSRATTGSLQIVSATRTPFTGWSDGWSANFWVRGGADASGYIYWESASHYLAANGSTITWVTPQGGTQTGAYTIRTGAWSMITCVQYGTATGATVSELFINGAVAATNTSSEGVPPHDLGAMTSFYIGCDSSPGAEFRGPISNVLVTPCRLSSAVVSSLYNSGSGTVFGSWPRHRITGDIVGSRGAMTAFVKITGLEAVEYSGPSGWVNNARAIQFTITEV